ETVGLEGHLVCEPKQRNFRMDAKALGSTLEDLGDHREEFWFWIKRAPEPYLYHCRHEDFASGRARMPFPFQPDWIVEALGIADYDPTRHYVVEAGGENIDLVENAVSPQGAPVRKVTRFTRRQNHVQVSAHLLEDANRQIICSAYIRELQQDRTTGAVLPRQVLLSWPAQQIRMKMTLEGLGVNQQMAPQRVALLFSRPNMGGVQSFDLARGPDVSTGGLRQTNGYDR
ncbi:MAG: hypothetical protein JO112_20305, partial [Planctomycetes bacterium]|nr:hypothetical protein [Planctomycetota bacterium]